MITKCEFVHWLTHWRFFLLFKGLVSDALLCIKGVVCDLDGH